MEDENKTSDDFKFEPPVYKQRYKAVHSYISDRQFTRVLDFGCAECKLIKYLIRRNITSIGEIVGVDIDGLLLESNAIVTRPLTADFLYPREQSLTVSLYQGSIAEPDRRFVDFDLITCVELIEHLNPDILDRAVETLFGYLRPASVLITTPNSEFNVFFNLTGFRHWDHRFEWTRQEFQKWGDNIATLYGYSVCYSGVGDGPAGTEHLGSCSQMAIFEKAEPPQPVLPLEENDVSPYKLISSYQHPFKPKKKKLIDLVVYHTYQMSRTEKGNNNIPLEISLDKLLELKEISQLCEDSKDTLRDAIRGEFEITEDCNTLIYPIQADNDEEESFECKESYNSDNLDIQAEEIPDWE